ncbi:MAG: molybdopterin-dependent oxidoreductase [Propionibacteriaceae bacterium]|jgi:methionine sulfoxide reductase catalytic subunit
MATSGQRPGGSNPANLPTPRASGITPDSLEEFRRRLATGGEDVVDPKTWSGSLPNQWGTAPMLRVGRSKWFNLLWLAPIGFGLLIIGVVVAQALRELPSVQAFIEKYPGNIPPPNGIQGIPAWANWQHFFNLFLMTFIIRSAIQILTDHPRLYWTRHSTPGKDWFRFQKEVPPDPLWTAKQDSVNVPGWIGIPGLRHSIGLARWWHLGADMLWLLNGLIFYILIFSTGHWQRLVPTSWDYVPSAISVGLQYLSLDWPAEMGWTSYNALQVFAYFFTVFIAAPAALITGLGMSPALSTRLRLVSTPLSIQVARSLHFLIMVWFLVFIWMHVTLVLTTGMRANLNHMFAARNDDSWVGFWMFAAAMLVLIIAWVAATPFTLRNPRLVQRLGMAMVGPLQRLFEHLDAKPGQYTEADISPYFWHNGKYPQTDEYKALYDSNFADYRLKIGGLVKNPVELDLKELRTLPYHEQITQHFCIQGWSGIAKWGGVSLQTILDLVQPDPDAEWVAFYSLGEGVDGGIYYDAHPIEHMRHHLTMLAYDMNGEPLNYGQGAPLRLRNESEHGFKQVKWLGGIEFVRHFSELGAGRGGYNQDHEFFGYRHAI